MQLMVNGEAAAVCSRSILSFEKMLTHVGGLGPRSILFNKHFSLSAKRVRFAFGIGTGGLNECHGHEYSKEAPYT